MSAHHLSSRQLDAFIALAEQRSFTRAAMLCHLSQPAFSALIRALEDDLGLRLFDRSTRHVDLTPEGQNFLESARRIRAEITLALTALRNTATLQRGRVAVALLPSLAAGWLPGVLAQYRAAHPGIETRVMNKHTVTERRAIAEMARPLLTLGALCAEDEQLAATSPLQSRKQRSERFCSIHRDQFGIEDTLCRDLRDGRAGEIA